MTGPDPLEGADPPRARLTEAVQAHRAKFGRMPPIMGIPSTRYPELIAELWAAVRDGVRGRTAIFAGRSHLIA